MITQTALTEPAKPEQSIVVDWRDVRAPSSASTYDGVPRAWVASREPKSENFTVFGLPAVEMVKLDTIKFTLNQLNKVTIDDIEPETADNWYFEAIRSIDGTDEYASFLRASFNETHLVKKSILKYLASKNYSNVSLAEESYILDILKTEDLDLQSYALDAVFEWERFSDVDALAKVNIKNKYLGGELADFLNVQK